MEIVKAAKEKVDKTVTFFKKVLGVMMAWGLVFSLVTIGGLRVAFDYDDTLVFSTPAYAKAFKSGTQPFSPQFWETLNTSYDLESRKVVTNALAGDKLVLTYGAESTGELAEIFSNAAASVNCCSVSWFRTAASTSSQ